MAHSCYTRTQIHSTLTRSFMVHSLMLRSNANSLMLHSHSNSLMLHSHSNSLMLHSCFSHSCLTVTHSCYTHSMNRTLETMNIISLLGKYYSAHACWLSICRINAKINPFSFVSPRIEKRNGISSSDPIPWHWYKRINRILPSYYELTSFFVLISFDIRRISVEHQLEDII